MVPYSKTSEEAPRHCYCMILYNLDRVSHNEVFKFMAFWMGKLIVLLWRVTSFISSFGLLLIVILELVSVKNRKSTDCDTASSPMTSTGTMDQPHWCWQLPARIASTNFIPPIIYPFLEQDYSKEMNFSNLIHNRSDSWSMGRKFRWYWATG